ncbi:uncharacterized protein LOC119330741 [Triticum dicoccoides]|uniref:uncharacterized protein LOC119330741 n=1 Tax=Triticum dicoccoides TaxID=85692 RepID=UPI001890EF78|nr:uncharacterized protein LOC119330741 [Triticum dicoccoides]
MDRVQGGESMAPALAAPGTSPAADCRSTNQAAGDPSSAVRSIDGGWSGSDLSWRPDIQDIARVPDETPYSKVENPPRVCILCLVHGARLSCALYMARDGTILHGHMTARHLQLCHLQMC